MDGSPALVRDASLTGLSLLAPGSVAPGQRVVVRLPLNGSTVDLPVVVRTVAAVDGAGLAQVGVEFHELPERTAAALALALFRTGIAPRVVYPADATAGSPAGPEAGAAA